MTLKRQQVGRTGEAVAACYLQDRGYIIVESNYRCSLGEIDLVAYDGDTVVLVEVRTKTGFSHGSPEESINAEKARRLQRMALFYLKAKGLSKAPARIDLVAVLLDRTNLTVQNIRHIKGILSG